MAQIRLYIDAPLSMHANVALNQDQSHYLLHVMRLKEGSRVALFNGHDGEWEGEVTMLSKKAMQVLITSQTRQQRQEPDIWLAFAPIKNAAIHFTAQKATELGVSALMPVITEHTIVHRIGTEKLLANAIEAAEQSERLSVPTVSEPQKLSTFLDRFPKDRALIFCDESGKGKPITQALQGSSYTSFAVLIGPEGGFSLKELDILHHHPHVIPVGLGPRILRADTAALAALACLQAACGDWNEAPRFVPSS